MILAICKFFIYNDIQLKMRHGYSAARWTIKA